MLRTRTPSAQVIIAWLSHSIVIAGVTLIAMLGLDEPPPALFFLAEGILWFLLASLTFDYRRFVNIVALSVDEVGLAERFEIWQRRGYPIALALSFVLQFVALTPLLRETGGPIDSPFAPLVLVYAVGSGLMARTFPGMLGAGIAALAYYAAFVLDYGFATSFERPASWVYIATMGMIIALVICVSSLLTLEALRGNENLTSEVEGPPASSHREES